MRSDPQAKLRTLSLDKALAIAAHDESVAAYPYRTLTDKTDDARLRRVFAEMADEEQGRGVPSCELQVTS